MVTTLVTVVHIGRSRGNAVCAHARGRNTRRVRPGLPRATSTGDAAFAGDQPASRRSGPAAPTTCHPSGSCPGRARGAAILVDGTSSDFRSDRSSRRRPA